MEWEFHGEQFQILAAGGGYQSCHQLVSKVILSKVQFYILTHFIALTFYCTYLFPSLIPFPMFQIFLCTYEDSVAILLQGWEFALCSFALVAVGAKSEEKKRVKSEERNSEE